MTSVEPKAHVAAQAEREGSRESQSPSFPELRERITGMIADLRVAAMPTKPDVVSLCGWSASEHATDLEQLVDAAARALSAEQEVERLKGLLNTPQLHDFSSAVMLEAAHQRERWGSSHDAGKEPSDWFWLVGYLAGKALNANTSGNTEKALHHTISTAAALANWHAAISGEHTEMRPGIDPEARGVVTSEDRAGSLARSALKGTGE